jgi:hypothetical protein
MAGKTSKKSAKVAKKAAAKQVAAKLPLNVPFEVEVTAVLERTAAAVYSTRGRASRVYRRGRSTGLRNLSLGGAKCPMTSISRRMSIASGSLF